MVKSSIKKAFTLIELVFAIVVIGIAVLSLPMISQVLNVGMERNLVQEAILLASADTVRAISGKWDENSKPNNLDFEYIVFTSNAEVTAADGNTTRPGNIRILYHPNNALRPTSGLDAGETITTADDIDDYITGSINAVDDIGSATNFKDQYKKVIAVTANSSFGTLVNNANIKKITVTIQDSSSTDLVQLYMYVTNSGSSASLTRSLP